MLHIYAQKYANGHFSFNTFLEVSAIH